MNHNVAIPIISVNVELRVFHIISIATIDEHSFGPPSPSNTDGEAIKAGTINATIAVAGISLSHSAAVSENCILSLSQRNEYRSKKVPIVLMMRTTQIILSVMITPNFLYATWPLYISRQRVHLRQSKTKSLSYMTSGM